MQELQDYELRNTLKLEDIEAFTLKFDPDQLG